MTTTVKHVLFMCSGLGFFLKETFKKLMRVVVKLIVRRKRRSHGAGAEPWSNMLTQSPSESAGLASRFGTVTAVRRH